MARARRLISVTIARVPKSDVRRGRRHGEQHGSVGQPFEPLFQCLRLLFELEQALRQRDERAGEVAAIDRRDIPRVQRRPRRRVVPVQEVTAIAFEPFQRRQGRIEPPQHLGGRQIAKIVRGHGRQHAHADIGRRRASRHAREVLALLKIVGCEPPVGFSDERVEVPPRLARRASQQWRDGRRRAGARARRPGRSASRRLPGPSPTTARIGDAAGIAPGRHAIIAISTTAAATGLATISAAK